MALLSGRGDPELTRYSYFFCDPVARTRSWQEAASLAAGEDDSPRAVGLAHYEHGWRFVDPARGLRPHPFGEAPLEFWIFDGCYVRDEHEGQGWVSGRASMVRRLLESSDAPAPAGRTLGELHPRWSKAHYVRRVSALLALIRDGEVYQANLTYPLQGRFQGDPRAAFARLAERAPPFAAFVSRGPGRAVVSASPECLLRFEAGTGRSSSFPIKGTRRRDPDPARDRALAEALATSEKDRAEHMMIVDLVRNDLGRVAEVGSVHVDPLAYVESFSTVHHVTSAVRAQVPDGGRAFEALFPGGSITGAPKLRAMEIIDDLEGEARGLYTGSVVALHGDGSITASIAIRTAEIAAGELRFGVGGGIVVDSVPEDEWEETKVKARALSEALAG
jgi:para-aminobenzoate synthetase component I